jgi:hypothetical protein
MLFTGRRMLHPVEAIQRLKLKQYVFIDITVRTAITLSASQGTPNNSLLYMCV